MSRLLLYLVLTGTLACSAFASDAELTHIDREELRIAAERYARDNPGFVPDLRSSSPPFRGWSGRSGRPTTQRCTSWERDRSGRIRRSPAARAEFRREHPCPATASTRGACPGYVIDHIVPLKRGGADNAENMQWQTKAEAAAKDRQE